MTPMTPQGSAGRAPSGLPGRPRRLPWTTLILAVVILIPALIGFAAKFKEFLALARFEEGSFAIVPILNYLLTSAGFLLLFGWAVWHGMFRDMERPKQTMMENERWLEEEYQREREEEEDHAHA